MTSSTLAVLAMALAFAALPAVAVAEPETNNPGDPFFEGVKEGTKFSVAGGQLTLQSKKIAVLCQEVDGSGEFLDSEAGSISFTFHKCSALGLSCTRATTTLPFHLKTIDHNGEKRPGMLITTNSGHFTDSSCTYMGEITGNGLVGTITSPEEQARSSVATLAFESAEAGVIQTHRFVTNDETEYQLESGFLPFEIGATSVSAEMTIHFTEEIEPPELLTTPTEE